MKYTDSLKLSIVVPVATSDKSWKTLLPQLAVLAPEHSWILSVSNTGYDLEREDLETALICHQALTVVTGAAGQADQINRAVVTAPTDWIWVLQSSTELSSLSLSILLKSLLLNPEAVHTFKGSRFVRCPGKRPRLRQGLGTSALPFGQLSFAFHRQLWQNVCGFTEDLLFGDDRVFCWRLRQVGFHVVELPQPLLLNPGQFRCRRLPQRWSGLG